MKCHRAVFKFIVRDLQPFTTEESSWCNWLLGRLKLNFVLSWKPEITHLCCLLLLIFQTAGRKPQSFISAKSSHIFSCHVFIFCYTLWVISKGVLTRIGIDKKYQHWYWYWSNISHTRLDIWSWAGGVNIFFSEDSCLLLVEIGLMGAMRLSELVKLQIMKPTTMTWKVLKCCSITRSFRQG